MLFNQRILSVPPRRTFSHDAKRTYTRTLHKESTEFTYTEEDGRNSRPIEAPGHFLQHSTEVRFGGI